MSFTTLKVAGADALRVLNEHRACYQTTGKYPFLIGDAEDLERTLETVEINEQDPAACIEASLKVTPAAWIAERQKFAEDYGYAADGEAGSWPGEIVDKGSINLHKDIVTGKIKPEVYLGLAQLDQPWHLPAILRFGNWNECPPPEIHCAFHRDWQEKFGASITGMSGDIVECTVSNPPTDRKAATELAWEQYWYCADIVDQGCGSVSNLAATLLNSPYWFFWWD